MDLDHDACYRALRQRDARFDGRFFTAVKTTKIYCRPICPAKTPLSKNVVFFASAIAAQNAGFRPCLRCRPETAPDIGAWRGAANSVSRALSLIELGALDDGGVDALAGRLGLGARQLRRLFARHLGASPSAAAQTRRILLAKQLIHETELPMADVAFAAGFGSIRRFNETFQTLFSRPPLALRGGARAQIAAGPQGQIEVLLRYRPPYDWPSMMAFLRARAIPGVEIVEGDAYARTIEIGGAQGVVRVEPADGDALRARIRFPKISALPQIVARLRRLFDLGADIGAIEAHLMQDAALAPLIAARPGLRAPGAWDGFELAMRAALGQQITVAGALRLAGKLVAAYGEKLHAPEPGLTHVFPSASALGSAEFAALGMPRSRAATLAAIVEAAAADRHFFDASGDLDSAVARLRRLRGVGEWTAHYIALRQLREPDAFPAADVVLMRVMGALEGCSYSAPQLLTRAENWRPWRAYGAQHLWAAA